MRTPEWTDAFGNPTPCTIMTPEQIRACGEDYPSIERDRLTNHHSGAKLAGFVGLGIASAAMLHQQAERRRYWDEQEQEDEEWRISTLNSPSSSGG